MPNFKLVIPLLNNEVVLLKGPFLNISATVYLEKITDEEHSALFRHGNDDIERSIKINLTKCIKVAYETEPSTEGIVELATSLNFLLNIFTEQNAVILQWLILVEGSSNLVVKKIVDFDGIARVNEFCKRRYKIANNSSRSAIVELYNVICLAIKSDKNAFFTLKKFNSSLTRSDTYDKIIDSTICLESLLSGINELSFRLSLSVSYLTSKEPSTRLDVFNKVKDLYDVRSKIVHGELDQKVARKIDEIMNNWNAYHELIKSSLIYYLIYVSSHTREQWNTHLKHLVLNIDNRIVI